MFGPRIKHFRKICDLTQNELAEKLHVSQGTIAAWEGEMRTPDLETIVKLCKVFGVTADMILGTEFDGNGTRLILNAAPYIELANELDSEQLSQWLSFGRWLADQNKSNATNHTTLSSSDNDS